MGRLYVGVSPRHSTTVGHVLSLTSGYISDQYHCVYDDYFSTVSSAEGGAFAPDTFSPASWSWMLDTGHEHHVGIEMDYRGRRVIPPDRLSATLSSTASYRKIGFPGENIGLPEELGLLQDTVQSKISEGESRIKATQKIAGSLDESAARATNVAASLKMKARPQNYSGLR
jgi:hypothetical protein